MPELGSYAGYVLSAYGGALVLLIALVVQSFVRAARAKAELDKVEQEMGKGG